MLHPLRLLRLSDDGLPSAVASPARSWRPRLVLGREFLLFESMPCKGVAWHELDGFARLQASRLAPYQRSGACAAVRQGVLMLWFWDEDEVASALQRVGMIVGNAQLIAEPLMLKLEATDGELRLPCHSGTDVLLLKGGAILRSRWEPHASRGKPAPSLRAGPWARDRLASTLFSPANGASGASVLQKALTALAILAVVACGARAAYWGGSYLAGDKRLAQLEANTAVKLERLGTVRQLQQREQEDIRWVQAYRSIGGSLQVGGLLGAIERPLANQRVVLKEIEVRGDEARLVIASLGPDLDLPALIAALNNVPGFDNVRLRQSVDAAQAEFSVRTAGFRRMPPSALTDKPQS